MADVSYGTGYNMGSQVGSVISNGPPAEDASVSAVITPSSYTGQALIVLGIAFVFLFIAVGPEGGLFQRGSRMLGVIAGTGAAMVAVNFTARTYSVRHPNGPLAGGLVHDL